MLDPKSVDFKELGFRAGLEVHHQIRSERKLFCRCPPSMEPNPEKMDYSFYRYFRPVLGEMGDFDPGMLVEFEKGYKVVYYACERNTCTYEMDETPPFYPDTETIKKGFVLAFYFNCSALAEEIVVNRKQYLDGSITTGFQRTFIVGRDGRVPVYGKEVRISNVYIEEDAARRVNWRDTSSRTVYFNLDRLGVPLTEIITDHRDIESPEELAELARQIGRVLRISHIGKRGIGAVRQDVNISIDGGNRVEIKGVQNLDMFDVLCRHEVVRQKALLEIAKKMKERGVQKEDFQHTYVDISHLFRLDDENKAFVTRFPKMKGLFGVEVQPNKDFGEEIFEKSMLIAGIPREHQFHSDEIMEDAVRKRSSHPCRLQIDERRCAEIHEIISPNPEDAFVAVMGPERRALHAMKKIVERVKAASEGVPQETRRLLPDGNSEFLRVIHGKERIYPDTDTPPIVVPREEIEECRRLVGKRPWELFLDLHGKYGLSQKQVDLLIREEKIGKFYYYVTELLLDAFLSFHLLIEITRSKRRQGIVVDDWVVDRLAEGLSEGLMTSGQIDSVIEILIQDPESGIKQAVKKLAAPPVTDAQLDGLIIQHLSVFDKNKIVSDKAYRKRAISKTVGEVLKAIKYSVGGKKIAERIQDLIKKKEN